MFLNIFLSALIAVMPSFSQESPTTKPVQAETSLTADEESLAKRISDDAVRFRDERISRLKTQLVEVKKLKPSKEKGDTIRTLNKAIQLLEKDRIFEPAECTYGVGDVGCFKECYFSAVMTYPDGAIMAKGSFPMLSGDTVTLREMAGYYLVKHSGLEVPDDRSFNLGKRLAIIEGTETRGVSTMRVLRCLPDHVERRAIQLFTDAVNSPKADKR